MRYVLDFSEILESIQQEEGKLLKLVQEYTNEQGTSKNGEVLFHCCNPEHNDTRPSMYVNESKNVFHCFSCGAGGGIASFLRLTGQSVGEFLESYGYVDDNYNQSQKVYDSLRMQIMDKVPRADDQPLDYIYIYTDEVGNPTIAKAKYKAAMKSEKTFRTYYINTDGLIDFSKKGSDTEYLYNLPAVKKAINKDKWVFLVEGEKDCITLMDLGFTATSCMTTKKWYDSYTEQLKDARVIIIPDNDETGYNHAEYVAEQLFEVVKELRVIRKLPDIDNIGNKADITDWFNTGRYDQTDLIAVVKRTLDRKNPHELQQDKYGIYKLEDGKKRYLTDFKVNTMTKIVPLDEGSDRWELDITTDNGDIYNSKVKLKRDSFNSRANFNKELSLNHGYCGSDSDLHYLRNWFNKYFGDDTKYYSSTSGVRKVNGQYIYITSTGAFDSQGNSYGNVYSSSKVSDIQDIKPISKEEFRIIEPLLMDFNTPSTVYSTLGMAGLYTVNHLMAELEIKIPHFYVWGLPESGKSSTTEKVFKPLFGVSEKIKSAGNLSKFIITTSLTSCMNVPFIIDEFKRQQLPDNYKNSFDNIYRSSYDRQEALRGQYKQNNNGDMEYSNSFPLIRPMVIVGESPIPQNDKAMYDRSVVLQFVKNLDSQQSKNWNELVKHQDLLRKIHKTVQIYALSLDADQLENIMLDAKRIVRKLNNPLIGTNDRINNILHRLIEGIIIFEEGVQTIDPSFSIDKQYAAQVLLDNFVNESLGGNVNSDNLYRFFQNVGELIEAGKLFNHSDYIKVYRSEGVVKIHHTALFHNVRDLIKDKSELYFENATLLGKAMRNSRYFISYKPERINDSCPKCYTMKLEFFEGIAFFDNTEELEEEEKLPF